MEVQQHSFIPPPPPPKRKMLVPLIMTGLIVVVGLYIFARIGFEIPWLDNFFRGNAAQTELKSLKRNAKVPFNLPIIINEAQADFSAMPERARALFPSDHKAYSVDTFALSDGSTGFRVEYHRDTQLINEYGDFLDRLNAQGPYKALTSTRLDNAAYSVMENQFHKLEAEFLQSSANSIIVRVMILLK